MYSLTNLVSSDTIGDFQLDGDYVPRMDLNQRIFKARQDAKLTQQELADAVGKTRGAVAQWESGEVRPRHSTLEAVADATGKPIAWLVNGGPENQEMKVGSGLQVVGEVNAGIWKEPSVVYERYFEPVAPHPDYPPKSQRLYRVSGNSINKIAGNGEFLHAVEVYGGKIEPEPGDLVIVRRMQHGLAEYTAKTLVVQGEVQLLRPESWDPEWQSDIEIDGDEATDIEITDVVIAKWCPLRGRRPGR